jgi:predicted dehydrogenase
MSKIYRAAVLGAGSGGKLSMRGLAASERYELVAVADINASALEPLQPEFPHTRWYTDPAGLLAAEQPEVVCVSTWPPSHLPITQMALATPLTGILVEKPLADTYRAGVTLLDTVRDAKLPMVVPHGLLVADHSRRILELVRDGAIGSLRLVEIECAGWDIINAGIHWLNFALALMPEERAHQVMAQVDASTRTYRDGMMVETEAITYVTLGSGKRIVMHTGDFVPVAEAGVSTLFRLVGSHGLIEFFGWKPSYRIFNADHQDGVMVDVPVQPRSGHQRYLEMLAQQMDSGQVDYGLAELSLAALEICEAAYLSARLRGAVQLPLEKFVPPAPVTWEPGLPYPGSGGGRDGRRLEEAKPKD